jgi:hypothetical protein
MDLRSSAGRPASSRLLVQVVLACVRWRLHLIGSLHQPPPNLPVVPLLHHCYSSIHPSKRASAPLRLEPVGLPAGPTEVRECQALVLLAQQLSIAATCSRRLCCGARLPRDVHHKVRSTSAGRVDLDQQPGSAQRHRYRVDGSSCPASQVLAVRVAGCHHRYVACQSDLRAFAVPRARRTSSAWWRRSSRCCSASVALSDGW